GCDLSDGDSIRAFVDTFLETHDQLHVLVNNAAAYSAKRVLAPSGFESTWATNVLGPYLMTDLLIDVMAQTGDHRWHSRVVNICSNFDGGLESRDTQYESRRYDGVKAYKASKQAFRMLTWDLGDRLPGTGIVANACFPGRVDTPLGRLSEGKLSGLLKRRRGLRPVAVGADTPIWLASSPEVEGISGELFFERAEIACKYRDISACAALGAYCADQLGIE
ncbi:MAG: SDR family NAD(P)-dependent oxidoreductase, partial [Myxococcota bacterium]|nr:SDR family NAD(P)-dependent oxidoreductase [Myxococcota bacterium]